LNSNLTFRFSFFSVSSLMTASCKRYGPQPTRGSRRSRRGGKGRLVVAAIPSVAARLPTYTLTAGLVSQEVLGDKAAMAGQLEAATFDSMVFLNRGDHFEARRLPIEAQLFACFRSKRRGL
jgi:hypothetical protein